jgi:hypothetical protein
MEEEAIGLRCPVKGCDGVIVDSNETIQMIRSELNAAILHARMETPQFANDKEKLGHLIASIELMTEAEKRLVEVL